MPRSPHTAPLRVAVDTGGTFTDCVWVQDGQVRILKVFSTPADPSQAIAGAIQTIVDGVPRSRSTGNDEVLLLHGTTVGTNTLLQRKGARVAFVTTAGFEDTIEIGRQARPKLYDFFFDRVPPLVASELRFGVEERIAPDGSVLTPLPPAAVRELVRRIREARPDAVAISLLFSFANPAHERALAQELGRDSRPSNPGLETETLPVSLSSEILPEFREYERASTVVVNAYLQPVMQQYLDRLSRRLNPGEAKNRRSSIFVMQSSGGITSLATAAREPVRTVLSGPAGGVVGASAMARRSGLERIIGFDMGGTSTDVTLVDGIPRATNEAEVAGLPVRVPMLDIHTVGAGGGSLARFDAAGALRVGPESAGAAPGPICYGKGEQPTVTDANLLLGRLRPDRFLGGEFTLDVERARRIVRQWLKDSGSRLSPEEFAAGVIRVVNATMEKAIRVVSIERGYDPRDFALVAFGGAGGLHACELAAGLGIPRVIVPALPGALSAYGILVSDVVKDFSRTVLWRASGGEEAGILPRVERELAQLKRAAERAFREENWRGQIRWETTADLRYRGQGYELNVPAGRGLLAQFHAEHQRRYGYSHPKREVEIVTVRLRARIPAEPVRWNASSAGGDRRPRLSGGAPAPLRPEFAAVHFAGKPVRTRVVARESLPVGRRQRGPAIVTEYSATTVVPPGLFYQLDRAGNLVIDTRAR